MTLKFSTKTVVVLLLVIVALLSGADLTGQLEVLDSITNTLDTAGDLADRLVGNE